MKELEQLRPLFQRLRMNLIAETLEETISEAIQNKWSYSDLLLCLFSKEVERREHKQNYYRLSRSGLDPAKTFELFDFNFNQSISKTALNELTRCQFISNKENIFFVGPSGVGKTHIANAIGHEACRKGYAVLLKRTSTLLDWLHSGHGDKTYQKKLESILKVPLLIIDDFGLIPLNEQYQIYLYEIISERHDKASTIITSNRDFGEWISIFDNPLLGSAAMDRLVHKAIKFTIEGKSYRVSNFKGTQERFFGGKKTL